MSPFFYRNIHLQVFFILRSYNSTKLLYGPWGKRSMSKLQCGNIFLSWDIWIKVDTAEGVLWLFEKVLNGCLFKLKACGPTSCLSWQITDFNVKIRSQNRSVLHHSERHTGHEEWRAMWQHPGRDTSFGKCVHLVFNLCCVGCVPPRLQTRRGSSVLGEYTMMSQTGKG